ncbi:MAG TPA: THUMP domain-containing protein [Bdellovibrionales bacterium]|nr:THUMP domain-containing protein [Bdellovibrionales bacterium]
MPRFFALTSRGLAEALEQELIELGLDRVERDAGGVFFESNWAGCYRANLRSRIATRIVLPILDFPAYKPEELYHNIQKHDFTKYIEPNGTMAVEASVRDCGEFRDQRFVAMKTKDAVVDQFRDKFEIRPDVDSEKPDLRIIVRAVRNAFSVSIDTSGDPLFKRGYREAMGEAHVKEHLAAGILRLTEWDRKSPLVDPMCGSGTFLIEAALMALDIAPGTFRRGFGFQRLKGFQKPEWEKEVAAALALEKEELPFKLYGFDIDRDAIQDARTNAEAAGVADFIELQRHPMNTLKAPVESGTLVVDPPYGVRMGTKDELVDTYKDLAHVFKTSFKGWNCFVLSGEPELSAAMKLKAERKFPLYNGPIECRLLKYRMF